MKTNDSTRENKHKSRERRALWSPRARSQRLGPVAKNMQAGRREGCGQSGELLEN